MSEATDRLLSREEKKKEKKYLDLCSEKFGLTPKDVWSLPSHFGK